MEYNFANGTAKQKEAWRHAAHLLLNLPFDAIPLTVEIEFTPSVSLGDQTDFAFTTFTYDDQASKTEVRNDYPAYGSLDAGLIAEAAAWGLQYNAALHGNETAVHELGHSVFAAIPHTFRVKVAELFGAKSDNIKELTAGARWQDRYIEAIAETFKEAFLPRRYRVFANRTSIKLPYSEFPKFRRLIREGLEAIEGANVIVPEYDIDIFKAARAFPPTRPVGTEDGIYTFEVFFGQTENGLEVFDSITFNETEKSWEHSSTISILAASAGILTGNSVFEAWVLDGTTLEWAFEVPDGSQPFWVPKYLAGAVKKGENFVVPDLSQAHIPEPPEEPGSLVAAPAYDMPSAIVFQVVNEALKSDNSIALYQWEQRSIPDVKDLPFGIAGAYDRWGISGPRPAYDHSHTFAEEIFRRLWKTTGKVDKWITRTDAAASRAVSESFKVDKDTCPETKVCNGNTYRKVSLFFSLQVQTNGIAKGHLATDEEVLALIESELYPWLPTTVFLQPECSEGEGGAPIILPSAKIEDGGASGGSRPHLRAVVGNLA